MRTTPRSSLTALAAGLALALTACGGTDAGTAAPASSSTAAPTTSDGLSTTHNEADVAFVNGMHPHHRGALEMAELAAGRASDPRVQQLATRIAQAQGPEIAQMEGLARAWGTEIAGGGAHGGGHGSGHGGGAMPDDTAALEPLTGPDFDGEFLRRMTAHHQSALPMARTELADGSNPQAKALAQEILDAQQAEIDEMQEILGKL